MSTTTLFTALRIEQRPIVSGPDATAVREFCELLRDEPRFVVPSADAAPAALDASRLLHPAGPTCMGAFLGDTLVGLARTEPVRGARSGAHLLVVVRAPWRRSGLGTRLVRTVLHDPSARELRTASMFVARSNRAALALGRACGMERIDHGAERIELRASLGSPSLRCA